MRLREPDWRQQQMEIGGFKELRPNLVTDLVLNVQINTGTNKKGPGVAARALVADDRPDQAGVLAVSAAATGTTSADGAAAGGATVASL